MKGYKSSATEKYAKKMFSLRIKREKEQFNKRYLKYSRKALMAQFESQAGFSKLVDNGMDRLAIAWRNACMQTSEQGFDKVLNYGENVILYLLSLKDCKTYSQFLAITTMYVKLHCADQALVAKIVDMISLEDFNFLSGNETNDIFTECKIPQEMKALPAPPLLSFDEFRKKFENEYGNNPSYYNIYLLKAFQIFGASASYAIKEGAVQMIDFIRWLQDQGSLVDIALISQGAIPTCTLTRMFTDKAFYDKQVHEYLHPEDSPLGVTMKYVKANVWNIFSRTKQAYERRTQQNTNVDDNEFTSQSSVISDFLKGINSAKNSVVAAKISSAVATLLALGFVSETKELSMSVRGLNLFRIKAAKGQKSMVDLVEILLSTMQFICERGYKCFVTKSIDPFLYDDDTAMEFQEDYLRIVTNFEYVKLGTYKGQNKTCPWASENDFERDLEKVISDCREICKSASNYDRVLMLKHLERLLKVKTDFELVRTSGGLREAPFSFCIFGKSGIGKSTIVNNLMSFALQTDARVRGVKDYIVDPNSICTLNELDKYHSDYKSHIEAVLLDDFANAKGSTTQVNPTVNVINFINNVARTAIMAEADLKGKIQIKPKVVAATTNVKELEAKYYSNEPVSILRRFPLHIEARVRPDYLKDGEGAFIDGKKLAKDATEGNLFPDAWEFDCYEYYDPSQGNNGNNCIDRPLTYIEDNLEKPAMKIGVSVLLKLMQQMIKNHVMIQKSVVESSKAIFDKVLCQECGMHAEYCICEECEDDKIPEIDDFDSQTGIKFENLYNEYVQPRILRWENFIPNDTFYKTKTQWFVTWFNSRKFFSELFKINLLAAIITFIGWPVFIAHKLMFQLAISATATRARKEYVINKLLQSRDLLPRVIQNIRDIDRETGKKIFFFASAVFAIYAAYKLFKHLNSTTMDEQGNGMSVHMETNNVWLQPKIEELPKLDKASRTVVDDLHNLVVKQLVHVELGERFCNGLFVGSNMLLIPGHEIPTSTMTMKIRRDGVDVASGLNFDCMVSPADCVLLKDCDVSLVYCPRSGDRKDLLEYFPTSFTDRKILTRVLNRTPKGDIQVDRTRISEYKRVNTDKTSFIGGICKYSSPTFGGQCMSVHVFEGNTSFIAGFHAAGVAGTTTAAITRCTKQMIVDAKDILASRPTCVFATHSGTMITQSYGKDFTPRPVIEPKSPANFQEDMQLAHFGTMPEGRVRPKSSVIVSPASAVVTEVTGNVRQHGKPANCRKPGIDPGNPCKDWAPYQKYLSGAGNAFQEFPADVLEWAYNDYISGFDKLAQTNFGKDLLSKVRVLDDVETVSGVDGLSFVDAMKPNTSMGWPANKPKKDYLVDLVHDPDIHKTTVCPRALDDETLRLAHDARVAWLDGHRSYDIFKTCTKDEPTKITKDKVRCFQASPVSLQFNIRKYFLTLCHFMSNASLTSECAVGINSQGKGWHEVNEHMVKFGVDRIVAGDFKAYDQHMSARMTLMAAQVFEHIAKLAGYSDEDLKIMRGASTEVSYPVMSLNGELIQLFGSNPSGQNLTVYTNSIVNSLYHRCAFRSIYLNFKGRYADVVALMTYGDDVKMSVHNDFSLYNHTNIQLEFNKQGIEYTMAEKEAESVPFIQHEDADFLKRKSRWEPSYQYVKSDGQKQQGMWLAMLDEESIFKSLHANLASKVESPQEVSVGCIEGALREWWFYGKTHFNFRHQQMMEVVEKLGWNNYMSDSFLDNYELREAKWLDRNSVERV
jgi:hypothetical protein